MMRMNSPAKTPKAGTGSRKQSYIQLVPTVETLPAISLQHETVSELFQDESAGLGQKVVVSWLAAPKTMRSNAFLEIDGLTRCNFGNSVAFVGVLSANELCHPMLWDTFHAMSPGGEILLVDYVVNAQNCILFRSYFSDCIEIDVQSANPARVLFRKTAQAPAERDRGLEEWSFCLPLIKPQAASLAEIKTRIESLGVPRFELLICCAEEFRDVVSDYATMVPEPSGGTLTAKKNALAAAAQFGNLCIFHDRVVLPKNFMSAVHKYGDAFGLAHFQSVVLDPVLNKIVRYSDYHVNLAINAEFFGETDTGPRLDELLAQDSGLFREWHAEFAIANPRLYTPQMYGTGTLYICKKSVWELCGQSDLIDWNELEDLEHGQRASSLGIPSRVNPHAFTRTRRARSVMLGPQIYQTADWTSGERGDGQPHILSNPETSDLFDSGLGEVRGKLFTFIDDFLPATSRRHANSVVGSNAFNAGLSVFQVIIELLYHLPILREPGYLRIMLARLFGCFPFGAHDDNAIQRMTAEIMRGAFHVDVVASSPEFQRLADLCESGILRGCSSSDTLSDAIRRCWTDRDSTVIFEGDFGEFSTALTAAFQ